MGVRQPLNPIAHSDRVKAGEQDVVVKAPNTFSGEMGGSLGLALNPERVFLFRAQSGERIR